MRQIALPDWLVPEATPIPIPAGHMFGRGDVTDFDLSMTEGRTAVLAVGSNRAPSRLDQKYIGKYEVPIRSSMRASRISISSTQRI